MSNKQNFLQIYFNAVPIKFCLMSGRNLPTRAQRQEAMRIIERREHFERHYQNVGNKVFNDGSKYSVRVPERHLMNPRCKSHLFVIQPNGQMLLLHDGYEIIWFSPLQDAEDGPYTLKVVKYGRLELVNADNEVVWKVGLVDNDEKVYVTWLKFQQDGNLVLYIRRDGKKEAVWATGTERRNWGRLLGLSSQMTTTVSRTYRGENRVISVNVSF